MACMIQDVGVANLLSLRTEAPEAMLYWTQSSVRVSHSSLLSSITHTILRGCDL